MNLPTFGSVKPGVTYVDRPAAYALILNPNGELAVVKTSLGLFLPGGGLDDNESPEEALSRELHEEVGFKLLQSTYLGQAVQYVWSEFYQEHFRKIGSFYRAEVEHPEEASCQSGHSLLWLPRAQSLNSLSQEFQRWAIASFT